MRRLADWQNGFTLVEVVTVLAVSGVLLGGMWQFYHSSLYAYRRGLQEVRLTQGARTMLRLMTRDIQKALATAALQSKQNTPRRVFTGDAERLEFLTGGSPASGILPQPAPDVGVPQRIRYVLEPASADGTRLLKRAVMAVGSHTTERLIPLAEGVQELHFRYFDGQTWSDTWQQATPPRALEISVAFQARDGEVRTHGFSTIVTAD
ncbi:MAG TPA: type II secretion system protein GspJ [Candidatus Tectomicrobia bacterium]|jgi:prepilin-type N-terminal cleavage/methylation domain-containing protein